MKSLKILFLYFLFIIFSLKIVYAYTEPNDSNDIEKLLIKSLYEIADGNLNNALLTIDTIIEKSQISNWLTLSKVIFIKLMLKELMHLEGQVINR